VHGRAIYYGRPVDPELRAAAIFDRLTGGWERPLPEARPPVAINMISTVDGKVTVAGRVGNLTSPVDQRLLKRLRAGADAVLVGAETVRVERYSTLAVSPAPPLVVVSASLDFPPDHPSLHDTASPLIFLTPSDRTVEGATRTIQYVREPSGQLGRMLERLRAEHGIERVVCEGGPHFNAWLFAEGLVDEMFLSISPAVVGGLSSLTAVAGSVAFDPVPMQLAGYAEDEGYVYLRYLVGR